MDSGKRAARAGRAEASDGVIARAVQRAKVELERMIDLTPQSMLLVDGQGVVGRANLAFLRLAGVQSFPDVLGRNVTRFFAVDAAGFFDELLAVENGHRAREARAVRPDGGGGIFRFTAVAVGSESAMRVLIVEEITAEKERAALDEKEHKKDAVRALAGALMHRINQRLTVITVRSKLMRMALEKEDAKRDELLNGLDDIVSLTMEIASILQRLEDQKDFVTETYLDGMEILDLERSSGKE